MMGMRMKEMAMLQETAPGAYDMFVEHVYFTIKKTDEKQNGVSLNIWFLVEQSNCADMKQKQDLCGKH